MADARDALFNGQTSAGQPVRRPMSPHLQAYDMVRISSGLSILNRMSGIAISFGTILMVWWLVAASQGPAAFADVQWFTSSILGIAVLVGWTLALVYHLFAGLRHLAWDAGYGFSLPAMHRSGRLVIAATVIVSLLVIGVGIAAWH